MGLYWSFSPSYNYGTPGFAGQGANGYGSTAMASTLVGLMDTNFAKKMPVVNINLRMMNNGTLYTWAGAHKPALDAVHNDGRIPFCTWGLWDLGNRANNFSLRLAAIAAGTWDGYFQDFFQGAALWGHPFWVRPFWEFNVRDMWATNGNFPWCVGSITDTGHSWTNWAPILGGTNPADGSTTSDFVRAWRHIYNLRNQYGATNVQFVWCPNGQSSTSTDKSNPARTGPLPDFWPGASYVDWMGPDLYQTGSVGSAPAISAAGGSWASLQQLMRGASGLGLLDTWQNILNCDESNKIPMCIPETNANLSTFVTGSDTTGRVGRAAYLKEMYETSCLALPRMGLINIFYWYVANSGQVYTWEQYDDEATSLDGANRSPDGSGNAVLSTSLQDFVAAKTALGSAIYPDKDNIVLPADGGIIRPYWLEDVSDRYRKGRRTSKALVAYWRCTESSGNLADDSGNSHTATVDGTVSYQNTNVVPSNPTDGSVGVAGGTTNDFNAGNVSALDVTTTNVLAAAVSFVVTAPPAGSNAHIISKGAIGQFQYSLYLTPASTLVLNVWDLSATNGSAASSPAGAIVAGTRYLAQVRIDNVAKSIGLIVSSEHGGAWGDIVNTTAGYSLTIGTSTAASMIGHRAAPGDQSFNGHIGHVSFLNAIPSNAAMQEDYKNWLAAPVLSSVMAA